MTTSLYDSDKAVASMLHICNSLGGVWDKYSLLKILYFAEKLHISEYGRPITGDNIDALPYGPVPSYSYNTIKASVINPEFFEVDDNAVKAIAKANLDCLSDSDIECLDISIKDNQYLNFTALKNKSHDTAYDWTVQNIGLNSTIPYEQIALAAGASSEMVEYIKSNSENQLCCFNAPH